MRLLIFGSTGLVGRHLVDRALADGRIDEVVAAVRRPVPPRAGLLAPVVDFGSLPRDAGWWRADAAVSALGTTLRQAGSREAFAEVDRGLALAVARLASERGTPAFVLNSAAGADPGSRFFYNRVKGEAERDLAAIGFASLTLVRPGLIGGERGEFRPAERAASIVLSTFGPVLPRAWRINPADRIAAAMLDAAVEARPGTRVISSGDLA